MLRVQPAGRDGQHALNRRSLSSKYRVPLHLDDDGNIFPGVGSSVSVATIIGPTLPEPYYSTIDSIRDDLVTEFGVDEYGNPFPHFTLYPLDGGVESTTVVSAVEDAAEDHDPITVHTDGIGVFPGNAVWLPVAKSPELTALHADVVDAVEDLGPPPMPFYEPHRWFPHVGFAVGLDDDLTSEIVGFLLDYDLEWDFTVDSIEITQPPAEGADLEVVASIDL